MTFSKYTEDKIIKWAVDDSTQMPQLSRAEAEAMDVVKRGRMSFQHISVKGVQQTIYHGYDARRIRRDYTLSMKALIEKGLVENV